MEIEGYKIENLDELNFKIYNSFGQIAFEYRYEPDLKLAIQIWSGYVPYKKVIEIYLYIAKYAFINKQPIFGSITDISQIEGSFDETNEWLLQEYMPKAVKFGFKFAATVHPQEFYAELAFEELINMNTSFTTKDFGSFAEAYQWVSQCLSDLNQL